MAVTYQEEEQKEAAPREPIGENIRRRYPSIYIFVFIGLLLLPWLGFSGDLAGFPNQFFGRKQLLFTFANFRYRVLGDKLFPSLIMSKNDWMVFTGEYSLPDYQKTNAFSDEVIAIYQDRLDRFAERLNAKGIKFLMVIPPNKNTIYPEYLPAEVPVLGKLSRLEQFMEYEKEHGTVKMLDLRPALFDAKKERQVYYGSDTHWNAYGTHAGYREIMKALQKDFPALNPHPLEDYHYVSEGVREGDLSEMLGQVTITEEQFRLDPNFPRNVSFERVTMADPNIVTVKSTNAAGPSLPRLLMYRDSFASQLLYMLSDHFSEATYVWDFHIDESYIYQQKPDIVILECTERYIQCLDGVPQE